MTRVLILQQGQDVVADWTTGALLQDRAALARTHAVELEMRTVERLEQLVDAAKSARFDLAVLLTHWREDPERVEEVMRELREIAPRLVYLDTFDQSSSPLFSILPHVDVYVKKQLLRDRRKYSEAFRGGFIVADYCARQGLDLADWHFGSQADEGQLHKLMLGWNLGAAPRLRKRLRFAALRRTTRWEKRNIDVHYRVSLGDQKPGEWYTFHRSRLLEALRDFSGNARVLAEAGAGKTLSVRGFRRELSQSKICVSPFGYGEVTDRDYEIILQGGLLMKPDMSHLETEPNVYLPEETYVPIRWDNGDVEERCRELLAKPADAAAIARRAREEYARWFREQRIVARFGDLLERVALRA